MPVHAGWCSASPPRARASSAGVTSSRTRGKAFARLYEKYGFEHEGLHRRGRIIDGHVEDVIIMGLLLGP